MNGHIRDCHDALVVFKPVQLAEWKPVVLPSEGLAFLWIAATGVNSQVEVVVWRTSLHWDFLSLGEVLELTGVETVPVDSKFLETGRVNWFWPELSLKMTVILSLLFCCGFIGIHPQSSKLKVDELVRFKIIPRLEQVNN